MSLVSKPARVKAPPQDWEALREEWVIGQLIGGLRALSLTDFAKQKGLSRQTVTNKSSTMKWPALLNERKKANDGAVVQQLKERSERAIEEVQSEFVGREAEIRRRHIKMARGLQAKAMQKLGAIDTEKLSVREALTMLQLGLQEERFGLGIPEVYKPAPEAQGAHPEYRSVVDQYTGHKRVQEIAIMLMKKLKEKGVSDAVILHEEPDASLAPLTDEELGLGTPGDSASKATV